MDKLKRLKDLTVLLNTYRDAYYNDNKPLVSDYEYDCLFDELVELEKFTGIIIANSPTQTVGYEVKSKLNKVKHSHPMLSLSKTKSIEELKKFIGDKDYIISCKMDGLTLLLTYDNGKLIKAETRGNGEIGEDVTHVAQVFENIPLIIPYKGYFEVEGEAIITYDDFEKINNKLVEDKKYKNPRNLASGSVRQLDNRVSSQRHLKFIAWKVPTNIYNNVSDNLNYLNKLGFTVVPYVVTNDTEHLKELIKDRKIVAEHNHYPIDGLVITYNDIEYGKSLGITGHHPKHSIAFKFYNEESETTLKNIEWTMGKTGVLTPTAIFEPVEIDGTIVERASLHNVSILTELDLQVGDIITVYKANEIIPQVKENLSAKNRKSTYIKIPSFCPICNHKTEIKRDNSTNVLVCTNDYCKGKSLGKLSHFVSKNAMNIDGLSESTLEKFIEEGFIEHNSFIDIYDLKYFYEDIIKLDGFGVKSTDKLLKSIEDSKITTLDRFIYSLCIPLVGKETAKIISKYCNNDINIFLDKIYNNFSWDCIEGIGSVVDNNIKSYSLNNYNNIVELSNYLTFVKNEFNEDNKFKNKIFVITGSLNIFSNREEVKEKIESLGGKVSGSISKNTSYLINNDINSMSSKNKKAKELDIPIITELELIELTNK